MKLKVKFRLKKDFNEEQTEAKKTEHGKQVYDLKQKLNQAINAAKMYYGQLQAKRVPSLP